MKYIAVGTTNNTTKEESRVVLVIEALGTMLMTEDLARKLADDLLQNANFLWPLEENDE